MSRDVTVSWDLPTTRTSGGPLNPSEIQFTRVELSADGGANYSTLGDIEPGVAQEVLVPELEFGAWFFRVSVFDTRNAQGEAATIEAVVPDDSAPAAVLNLRVEISE